MSFFEMSFFEMSFSDRFLLSMFLLLSLSNAVMRILVVSQQSKRLELWLCITARGDM